MEQLRSGKTVEDAREGGNSGCIETGAFGKEAYVLTGYLNVPKLLELALFNGVDPISGREIGLKTGDPREFETFDELYDAFAKQLNYVVDLKIRVNNYIERMFASHAPAPFLSVVIRDCIAKGKDYYNGGPRYNTTYIQGVGTGTLTDSLAAIGLIPDQLARKVRFAGNTSKTGCAMMLINADLREYLQKQVQRVEHLPLAEKISFQNFFIENLNFPDPDKPVKNIVNPCL